MSTVSVNLDTTQYVQVNTGARTIYIQSLRDDVRVALSETKPAVSNVGCHPLNGSHPIVPFLDPGTNVWALATTDNCSLIASEPG